MTATSRQGRDPDVASVRPGRASPVAPGTPIVAALPAHQSDPDPSPRRVGGSGSDPTSPHTVPLFIDGDADEVSPFLRPIHNINPPAKGGIL